MSTSQDHPQLETSRRRIAAKVRELRTSRRLTQRELAGVLGLSQNRLSEIERGGGSFSAEQLLLILRLFNVDVDTFDDSRSSTEGVLQNALIRFGADHLRQVRDAAASDRFRTAADTVAAVLLQPYSERFLTSLAPVLLRSSEDLALPALQADLVRAGRPHRLPWLVENTVLAIDGLSSDSDHPRWRKRALRARLVLAEFLDHLPHPTEGTGSPSRDALERDIRTKQTLEWTWDHASSVSRKWQIISAIQVDDFIDALRRARELH